jgi:uncharacterized protein (TIGR04255 family)
LKQQDDQMEDRFEDPFKGDIPQSIILKDAPLVRVLGQVRVPKIAKIGDEEYIANFQEELRRDYPHFTRDVMQGVELTMSDGSLEHTLIQSPVWRFFDPAKVIRISLTQDAITLETTSYVSRTDFLDRFKFILDCFQNTIQPGSVSRVGFRYVDRLQGEDMLASLGKFIQPELLGILTPELVSSIDFSLQEVTGKTREGIMIAKFGLAPKNFSHEPEMATPVNELSWVLDVDSYSTDCEGQNFDTSELYLELGKVADRAYAFFRWSVKNEFLERFGAAK